MKQSRINKSGGLSRRVHFPADEKRLPWLPLLLDSYAIIDTGVAIALRDVEKKLRKKQACRQGCDVCCRQADIPLYPHELVGIYWYASERLEKPIRDRVQEQLAVRPAGSPCPFLIDCACSIHPLRPVSCRQFNVFTTPCAPGEDSYFTRREDVLVPLTEYTDRAFAAVLTLYVMKPGLDRAGAIQRVRAQIMNLQTFDWAKLAAIIGQAGVREYE
jgi:uncharacterized protein